MRLWSIHPQYLDAAGLVALWREGLLAQAVLAGRTRGYRHHPQLIRFREGASIANYLHAVADEAERRGYAFDRSKLAPAAPAAPAEVTVGQLQFEWKHLKRKLRDRDRAKYREILRIAAPDPHPAFAIVAGRVAAWERRHSGPVI